MTVKRISSLVELNKEFKKIIGSGKVVAIGFWADLSSACKPTLPVFAQCAGRFTSVGFYKVQFGEVSEYLDVRSIHTVLIFRDGEKVDELVDGDPNRLELFLQNAQALASDAKITVKEINSYTQFKEIINSGRIVAIYFWAKCGPSRTISPIFEQLSRKTPGVEFYKVDVDEQNQISQEAGIRAVPTFLLFNKVDKLVGPVPTELEKLLQGAQTLGSDIENTVRDINSYTQFKEIINSGRVVTIYFWAKCGPCRVISLVCQELLRKTPGVEFYKVNFDEQEQISQEAGIRAVPTFQIFNKVDKLVGADPTELEQFLAQAQSRT